MKSLPEDINTRVRKLYDTGDYYVKISGRSQDFEKEYWGCVADPDGTERDLVKEFENSKSNFNYIVEYLKDLNPSKLLDIGCGLGALLAAYGSKNNITKLYGTELSNVAGKHASNFAKVFIGNLEDAGYKNEFFDAVTCHHVIEHVLNPEIFIEEINRVLKKTGFWFWQHLILILVARDCLVISIDYSMIKPIFHFLVQIQCIGF